MYLVLSPTWKAFSKNKLGITFDGVKTGPYADVMSVTRPMSDKEKEIIQAEIESIYSIFKQRVADGRKKDTTYIDSIAQGRVWTGTRAKEIGLIDKFGGIEDAVISVARKAGLTNYQVKEYPEPENLLKQLFGKSEGTINLGQAMKEELGEDNFKIYQQLRKVKEMTNKVQARLPFEFIIR